MGNGITSLPETELVEIGRNVRAPQLLQQAGYTIPLAQSYGDALAKLMAPGLIDNVIKARDSLAATYEDKTVMAAEAKLATGSQNMAMHLVKDWGKQAVARADAALLAGATLPKQLTEIPNARTVPARIAQAQRLLGLLTEHAATMDKVGAPTAPLVEQGRALCEALIAADSNQEHARAAKLPMTVANFYARKGELYIGLKMINQAGHEMFAHDPASSSRFNLSLLYSRYVSGSGTAQAPEPATTPAVPAPASTAPASTPPAPAPKP
jgi:hypothetical protein